MNLIWIGVAGFIILMAFAIYIYQLPPEKMPKRKIVPPPLPVKEKDWEGISKRWEKNNILLDNEIESLKKERKSFLDRIEDDKKLLREKDEQLAREKSWREKETLAMEKVKNVDHQLQDELREVQKSLDEEHSLRLRLDRELQDFKIVTSKLKDETRAFTVKVLTLESELDIANKELRELRRTNAELKKQREDIQWVAKADYDDVKMKLKQLESEVARLTRDQKESS